MNNPHSLQPRQLTALQIPAIDLTGNGGLGWEDLKDPLKGVALFAVMPVGIVNHERIELVWNGQVVQSFLADADRPSLDFTVLPQDIPDTPHVCDVFYRIIPAAGDAPEHSPVRQVRVKRTVPGNPDPDSHTPWINENLAPLEKLPPVIELPADLPLTIPAWDNMQEGDVLRLFWGSTAFSAENPPLPADDEAGKPQTLVVPAALQLAAGNLENLVVNYEIRDQVNNWSLYSVAAFTHVSIPLVPGPPTISEAPEGILEPLSALAGITVVVTYPNMVETDEISIRWNDEIVSTQPPSQPGSETGTVEFTVSPEAIAPFVGKTLNVTYVVVQQGNHVESDALNLTVKPLPATALPTPRITQGQHNQVLNVSALQKDAQLTVGKWPFMSAGQRLWLRFEGTGKDGSAYEWSHPVWQDFAVTDITEQSTEVALSELQKLGDDSNLNLILEASFDGGESRLSFPVGVVKIFFFHPVSGAEDWEAFPTQTLPLRDTIACANGMTLRVWEVSASIADVSATYPTFGKRTLVTAKASNLTFSFGGLVKALSLSHAGATTDTVIRFYDTYDEFIVRANLASAESIVSQQINLSRACTYCTIEFAAGTGPVLLDNLSWEAWGS